jgi:hypothetical protein
MWPSCRTRPETLVASAEQEWRRAVTFEGLEVNRNRSLPPLVMALTLEELIARNQKAEAGVREFLERRDILTFADLAATLHSSATATVSRCAGGFYRNG